MKKFLIGITASLLLGLIFGVSYIFLTGDVSNVSANDNSVKPINKYTTSNIEDAFTLLDYSDEVKLPEMDNNVVVNVKDFNEDEKILNIGFTEGESVFQIDISSIAVLPGEYDKKLPLDNGIEAYFYDNDILQFMYWEDNGIYYVLTAKKDEKNDKEKFTIEELNKLVSTFE